MHLAKLLVQPGSKLDLSVHDPRDLAGAPPDKPTRLRKLSEISAEIEALQDKLYAGQRHKVLIVLQGMDTAGKDGTIRHVFSAVNPLAVRAKGFRAPAGEEISYDYLWRVHRQVPRRGEIVIFNRSHYEDVLVVRVNGLIDASECARRLRQIREFERMLAETGTTIVKFFLNISREEQGRRLQNRIDDPAKQWKFDPTDLEARSHWNDYMDAYTTALAETSASWAPWYVIPSDSKSTRNLLVSAVLRDQLSALHLEYPQSKLDFKFFRIE